MSILIKGMELPECCDKCPLKAYAGSDLLVCKITGYRFYVWDVGWGDKPYTRHESCPLIEIRRHGRLIDADAFTKDECNNCDGACEALPCDCLNCKADCRCDFMKDIADAPTIIPADPAEEGE